MPQWLDSACQKACCGLAAAGVSPGGAGVVAQAGAQWVVCPLWLVLSRGRYRRARAALSGAVTAEQDVNGLGHGIRVYFVDFKTGAHIFEHRDRQFSTEVLTKLLKPLKNQ